ncbi:MAG: ion transporter, partial [Candidatus Cloacimonetes bacterium]|nr:ion transporter [Candidatus Cloacimonadota bacterium]
MKLKKRIRRYFKHREKTRRFVIIAFFIIVLIICSATVMLALERQNKATNQYNSFIDALWWAIVTITTVGYGDIVPKTTVGRIVGIGLIFVGFTLFSLFTGLIASLMVEDKLKGARGLKQIKSKEHLVICGWNETARTMLKHFSRRGMDENLILVGDYLQEFINGLEAKFPNLSLKYIRGDFTQKDALMKSNVRFARHVFILADDKTPFENRDNR